MIQLKKILPLILFVSLLWNATAEPVNLESLLHEMTDLNRLADFPDPVYRTGQISSYDRRSTDPTETTDKNWFANADAANFIREEERNGTKEYVMVDLEGPGALVRFWSANAEGGGILRLYLDGEKEPTLEMPMQSMMKGDQFPFLAPLAGRRAKGWNLYFPIPFSEHCKVTVSLPSLYYHVNYRLYPPETEVESFDWHQIQDNMDLIRETARRLAEPETPDLPEKLEKRTIPSYTLQPGQKVELHYNAPLEKEWLFFERFQSSALVRTFLKVEAEDLEAALRQTLLEIRFDGWEDNFVEAPLGDFFGTTPGLNPYRSLPSGVLDNGEMYCHWVMPFRVRCDLTITNRSEAPLKIAGNFLFAKRKWKQGRTLYFHADYHQDMEVAVTPRQDWNYITLRGRGRYVGNTFLIANPVASWWGEGDEKIYFDGEDFPSYFGTGTEDYYGYGWCSPELFTHAYHNQNRVDGPNNYGYTNLSRFHILDDLTFQKSLQFDMEVWHHAGHFNVAMAVCNYWYGFAGAQDNVPGLETPDLEIPEMPGENSVPDVMEAEDLEVQSYTGVNQFTQWNYISGWSGAKALWWTPGKAGETLEVVLPVTRAGRYELFGAFSRGWAAGIFDVELNGQSLQEGLDLYGETFYHEGEKSLGTVRLRSGKNVLRFTCKGKNDEAWAEGMLFILDYLRLKPLS